MFKAYYKGFQSVSQLFQGVSKQQPAKQSFKRRVAKVSRPTSAHARQQWTSKVSWLVLYHKNWPFEKLVNQSKLARFVTLKIWPSEVSCPILQ